MKLNRLPQLIGDELQLMQFGSMPTNTKPYKGVGSGIFEIAIRYATDAYRDEDLIRQRYSEAKELAKHEQ